MNATIETEPAEPKQRVIATRCRLPDTRTAVTHKFTIAGHEGYITVGLFEDGAPCELFVAMAKEGSTIGGLLDTIATLTSVALQYGIPLETLVKKFARQRFEPSGLTRNPHIRSATSIVDYIFRWMGQQFISGYDPEGRKKIPPVADANGPAHTNGETLSAVS